MSLSSIWWVVIWLWLVFGFEEYGRWILAAEETVESGWKDLREKEYNWSCFKSEQASQFALKALLSLVGKPVLGHDLPTLYKRSVAETGQSLDSKLYDCTLLLARSYISLRYPDAVPSGTPKQYFSCADAENAYECAERIVE
ncbi:hypothetical protein B9Q06_11445 [Candidatus Marsarchaeota G2 archaeon ECH_B_2]|uniref:HEPN domain-containing protein n=3 Tax=Candidatus Marsarchaeota group 2 TaxID=2203771 RepID=A0A2R6B5A8_9ARCH|nr:MAG: hypothetical protein B9Q06_11445 [Candidatus Marsarchaeota G2 archaeon ECH_B_2]PSN98060.1 MAG: hypothetical protein B9Q07_10760 [Candidatus Marsarchaeota G2 archaeon ECH_B_3]PSN99633.1 MAG: hypothetical protein B9Q05_11560 [Candidatus Marsarchaeota G2 archaeon ECH_B_1]